jgi:type I restriction enzyme S subunit
VGLIRFLHDYTDPSFLRLLLNSPLTAEEFDRIKVGGATHTNKLNLGDLHGIVFPVPPLAEQRRIVAKVADLMTLCDRLKAAQAERETRRDRVVVASLERLAESIRVEQLVPAARFHLNNLTSLTVRPEHIEQHRRTILTLGIQGKLTVQDPQDEPACKLRERVDSQKARLAKTGEIAPPPSTSVFENGRPLEPVPQGWCVAGLHRVLLELQTGPFGSSLHQADYRKNGTPVINPASIRNGQLIPIEAMAVGSDTVKRLATFKLRKDDIVLARRGDMGRCAVVSKSEEGWLCGTGSLILRPPSDVSARYLATLIGAPEARQYLRGSAVGVTMQNLNQSILLGMQIVLPPLAEQYRILARVDALMALCDHIEDTIHRRDAKSVLLLDSLLHEALAAPSHAVAS